MIDETNITAEVNMKTRLTILSVLIGTGLVILLFSGCYTQLGMTRNEQPAQNAEYTSDTLSNDSGYYSENNYAHRYPEQHYDNYNGGYPRSSVGFSYYYPSTYWPSYAFSVAYSDPWMYGGYSYYDPWWCGTPYLNYPTYGYNAPYGYYPYGYYGYGYGYAAAPARHVSRNFGSTRGTGRGSGGVNTNYVDPNTNRTRDASSGGVLTGAPSGGSTNNNPPSINNNGTSGAMQRSSGANTNNRTNVNPTRTTRGSNQRQVHKRVGTVRDTRQQVKPNEGNSTTQPSPQTRNNGKENRGVGVSRGGATHTSPSFVPTPPRSSGNTQPTNSGTRGGSSRGDRRP
jgi:hypothetical protein